MLEIAKNLSRQPNRHFHDFQERLTPEKTREFLEAVERKILGAKNLADWEEAMVFWNEVKSHIETHFEVAQLNFHRFTEDPKTEAEERWLREEIEPVYTEWNGKVRGMILSSPFRGELEGRLGSQFFLQLQLQQDAFEPKNIELETRLNKVLADYTKLTGGAFFEVEGKKYPLSHIKKFSVSADPRLREESARSYSGWFLSHLSELNEIFDKAFELRTQMGRNLGHPDFTALAYKKMRRVDYGPVEVAGLREQIRHVLVPLASKIRRWQADTLGTTRVRAWDLDFFPEWRLGELKVPIDGQTEAALEVYRKLSPRLGDHFKKMLQWGLIDVPARKGKAPGAFCTGFFDYRVPYVFLNSVGEASDVTTLLHESGHAFQSWESRGIPWVELFHPTLEACEVHSMGMEFLAYPFYEEFFSTRDADLFRKRHLAESIILLPYIAMIDEFQHRIYSGEAQGAAGRERVWEELEDKYMPAIDYADLGMWKRNRWIRQLHIFQVPFYYIDYAIAQIGAWQLWVRSVQDKDRAMEDYLKLCGLGGTLNLKEFFRAGNLRLPFEEGLLKELMDRILLIQPLP